MAILNKKERIKAMCQITDSIYKYTNPELEDIDELEACESLLGPFAGSFIIKWNDPKFTHACCVATAYYDDPNNSLSTQDIIKHLEKTTGVASYFDDDDDAVVFYPFPKESIIHSIHVTNDLDVDFYLKNNLYYRDLSR